MRDLGPIGQEPARLGEIARADLDVVAPLGQVDADGLDRVVHVMLLSRSRSAAVTVIFRMKPAWRRT